MNDFQKIFFTKPKRVLSSPMLENNLMRDLFGSIDNIEKGINSISYVKESSNYKLYEQEGNIIFTCLAPSLEEKDLDIKIDNRSLTVSCLIEDKNSIDFNCFSDRKFKFTKDIESSTSFAKLERGVLTITMPIKEGLKMTSVKFI